MQQFASAFHFAKAAVSLKQDCGPLFMLLAGGQPDVQCLRQPVGLKIEVI